MSTTQEYLIGSTVELLSSELNSLVSSSGPSSGAISSVGGTSGVFNNTSGGGSLGGYTMGRIELVLGVPGGSLTLGTAAWIWFIKTVDGTDYEDGSNSVIPARPADFVIPVRAVNTAQRIIIDGYLPAGNWYVLLGQNTGQTWASSGNTLKVAPITNQAV